MTMELNWDQSTNKDLLKNLLKDIFDSTDRNILYESDDLVKRENTQDNDERKARIAGLSASSVQPLADTQEIPLADATYGSTKDWTQTRHGLGFKISSGMKKFNRLGAMQWLTKSLKRAVKEYRDIDVFNMFNHATSTTYATGYDGLSLANTAHTLIGSSSTWNNYGDAALGVSSLQAAINYFDTLIDDNGDEIFMVPNLLVVHPDRRWEARELIGSEKKPYTADNEINAIQDWDLNYKVAHRLSSSTYWSLHATNDDRYDLFLYVTQEPDLKVQDAPDLSRSIAVTSEQWYTYGFGWAQGYFLGND